MRRHLPLLLMVVFSLGVISQTSTPSLAGGKGKKVDPVDPSGEPKGFKAGETHRYAVWHDKKGWHLRTTTAQNKHHFEGTIVVDGGKIEKIHSYNLEASGQLQDHWRIEEPARKKLTFDFKTEKGMDGITFTVSKDAKEVRFNLHMDGKHQADRIFVGQANHHPQTDPFLLPAHPKAAKK